MTLLGPQCLTQPVWLVGWHEADPWGEAKGNKVLCVDDEVYLDPRGLLLAGWRCLSCGPKLIGCKLATSQ